METASKNNLDEEVDLYIDQNLDYRGQDMASVVPCFQTNTVDVINHP